MLFDARGSYTEHTERRFVALGKYEVYVLGMVVATAEKETESENTQSCEVEEYQQGRAGASPERPSPREVEEHELTHVPFRSQCTHCIRG